MPSKNAVSLTHWLDRASTASSVTLHADPAAADDLAADLRRDDFVVRVVRGENMTTTAQVFDEFAAAFQFPAHFGRNKDAFDDVMRDLDDVLGLGAGYVVVVRNAESLLSAQPDERDWFRGSMDFYAEEWAPVVFRTVYQVGSGEGDGPAGELAELEHPDAAPLR